ncbi:MAG: transcription elongation factor GreA [Candidatus Omnitrophica bacterium]|nr:transcription elongation factor GreA [Candidatus Omnitrophota bacterium]
MSGDVYLTREGYEKLIKDLDQLKGVERLKISRAIGEARLLGDLKENAEYDAAKNAQAHCEARISELEGTLSRARIIEDEDIPKDKAFIGATVTLIDLDTNEESVYILVSPEESNYEEGKISITSPIGKALLGRKLDDEVEIQVPAGALRYKITKINR